MNPSMVARISGNLGNQYRMDYTIYLFDHKTLKNIDLVPVYGHFVLAMQGKAGIIASQNAGLGRCYKKSLPNLFTGDRASTKE